MIDLTQKILSLDIEVVLELTNANAVSMEATIATTISESVASLLIDETLSTIDFSITNMTVSSELVVAVSNVKSFIHGLDITIYAEQRWEKKQQKLLKMQHLNWLKRPMQQNNFKIPQC